MRILGLIVRGLLALLLIAAAAYGLYLIGSEAIKSFASPDKSGAARIAAGVGILALAFIIGIIALMRRTADWRNAKFVITAVVAFVVALAIPAIILFQFQINPSVPTELLHQKPVNGWIVVLAILQSIIFLVPYGVLVLLLLLLFDSIFFVGKYRQPYALAILGRPYPPIEGIESKKPAVRDFQEFSTLVSSVITDASPLLASSLSRWSENKYLDAAGEWATEQLEKIQEIFPRRPGDLVQASLWFVDGENLHLLTRPGLKKNASIDPLPIAASISGRAVRRTVGDNISVENIANARTDRDYLPRAKARYHAMLAIPICVQSQSEEQREVEFVLSINSALSESFGEFEVACARTVSEIVGAVMQRALDRMALPPGIAK